MSIEPSMLLIVVALLLAAVAAWTRLRPPHCPHQSRGDCDDCASFLQSW